MKKIPLTKGEVAIVDDCDYDYLMQWKWCVGTRYAVRIQLGKNIYMHKVILEQMGYKDFEQGDHINGNKLDNRRENLRPATSKQNSRNRPSFRGISSFRGVTWDYERGKWRSDIKVDGKHKFLGRFDDENAAAIAYNHAATLYYGKFAYLNAVKTSCLACASKFTDFLVSLPPMPLSALSLPETQAQAIKLPRYPVNLYACRSCGHVFNTSFCVDNVPYESNNNWMYNAGANQQQYRLDSINNFFSAGKVIVDIGAGNGEFLNAVKQYYPSIHCVAFEPGPGAKICRELSFETYQDYFIPGKHLKEICPDILTCTHVLEHMPDPRAFVTELAHNADSSLLFMAEVPCIENALKQRRVSDYLYEHVSHFTCQSFQTLFESSGWTTQKIFKTNNEEVIVWVGKPSGTLSNPPLGKLLPLPGKPIINPNILNNFKNVAYWGATGRSAVFFNVYNITKGRVIDSDARKAGRYVPGTGQLIEHAGSLRVNPVDTVIITTRWRAADIYAEIKRDYPCVKEVLIVEGDSVREYAEEDYIAETSKQLQ